MKLHYYLSLFVIVFSSCKKNNVIFCETTSHLRIDSIAPFYHGVASGDPIFDAIVIWTRVTPKFKKKKIKVDWYLSSDSLMKNVIKRGVFITDISRDFTVKVDIKDLEPGKTYYYQFKALEKKSVLGRTKTASVNSKNLNFAVVSCSDYQRGYFNSYAALAKESNLDAVIHLGDYIYEYKARDYSHGTFNRLHLPNKELISLRDYRTRYSQYKLDPDIIAAHRLHPFIVIWDDHETSNNTYMTGAQNHQPLLEGDFSERKSAALQAYYEWLPIREGQKPYRYFSFGNLADLLILEERLEGRTEQAKTLEDPALYDKNRSMLGNIQLQWFLDHLKSSKSKWKIIGNQVIFSYLDYGREDFRINLDSWDGYPKEREKIANFILDNNLENIVFVTGDTHQSWAFEVAHNPLKKRIDGSLETYAFEFGTPSINSGNSDERHSSFSQEKIIEHENYITNSSINPHLKYSNTRDHGYVVLNFNEEDIIVRWVYINTLFRRSDSIKKEVKFRGLPKNYKLKKLSED